DLNLYDRGWSVYSCQPSFRRPRLAVVPQPTRGRDPPGHSGASGISVPPSPWHNIFANGTVSEGWLRGAVVGFDCRIERGAIVEDSILFDGVSVGRGAEIRRAILDKMVQVRPGARVGFDPDEDRRRGFVVSEQGVTCVPR